MPCKQGPCQAEKLRNEGRNIDQNSEIPTTVKIKLANRRIRGSGEFI
jgi:hypothetical protein